MQKKKHFTVILLHYIHTSNNSHLGPQKQYCSVVVHGVFHHYISEKCSVLTVIHLYPLILLDICLSFLYSLDTDPIFSSDRLLLLLHIRAASSPFHREKEKSETIKYSTLSS